MKGKHRNPIRSKVISRDQVPVHWPYFTSRYGIVYRTQQTDSQEKMLRKFNDIGDDMMLFVVLKNDEFVFVPLSNLVDF